MKNYEDMIYDADKTQNFAKFWWVGCRTPVSRRSFTFGYQPPCHRKTRLGSRQGGCASHQRRGWGRWIGRTEQKGELTPRDPLVIPHAATSWLHVFYPLDNSGTRGLVK